VKTKAPLYRKVNTRARGVPHRFGGDYRNDRKKGLANDAKHWTMHGKHRRGLDYTPLFRFLLFKIGEDWDEVFSEAKARLDQTEPIFELVARREEDRRELVRVGESTYFSGLYIDEANRLQNFVSFQYL